ncbi:M48 family metallopeptidase [Massilia sp. B-10]|nr:M48 family metallopeptidase [Massilia sp. B-10]
MLKKDLGAIAWIMAICSLFIGAFMVKAIFSVRNAKPTDLHEVTAKDQPRLFAFLFDLADAHAAPRPHKVYLSARVNAAVFYDLSLFNLIFPSKKNLEIGLALVNTLTLGELRAVLAHEFGHFAQRSDGGRALGLRGPADRHPPGHAARRASTTSWSRSATSICACAPWSRWCS